MWVSVNGLAYYLLSTTPSPGRLPPPHPRRGAFIGTPLLNPVARRRRGVFGDGLYRFNLSRAD